MKAALAAKRGEKTIIVLAQQFAVYSSQTTQWRSHLLDWLAASSPAIFHDRRSSTQANIILGFVGSGKPVAFAGEQSPADQAPSADGTAAVKSLALSSIPEAQQPAISLLKLLFKRQEGKEAL